MLSMTELGLPEAASAISSCVIGSCRHTSPRLSTTLIGGVRLTFNTTTPVFTGYGLNFLSAYIHEFDHKFIGNEGGIMKFYKAPIVFTFNGTTHTVPAQELHIFRESTGRWVFKVKTYTETFKILYKRKFTDFTAEQLASIGGIGVDELYESLASFYYGVDRNPDTHMTSVFVKVNKNEQDAFTAQTYVNLQPITSGYGTKVTSYNKTGASYVVRWKLYNGCTAQNATSGGYEAGNFGLCELRQSGAYTEMNPQTFTWDASREYAVVECQIEELPAQGKNFTTSGYYTILGSDEDDPVGQSFRLPRKPVGA